MAFNEFMHPRNIYKDKPDFKVLASKYPEFEKFVFKSSNGKASINFKDPDALRTLTIVCLKNDFDLNVTIPEDKLVPTLPSRLNYILWIEDLLNACQLFKDKEINGVDIGTGACCIYPLLGCKKNGWKFIATEVNLDSIESAKKNVNENHLQNKIAVCQSSNEGPILSRLLCDSELIYDFTMCNPPFYDSKADLNSSHEDRSKPSSINTGSDHEIITDEGEVGFISQLITESFALKNKVRIFTSLLGKKTSVQHLKAKLSNSEVKDFTSTEFFQGNTMRWAIAWTFQSDIKFEKLKKIKKPLKKSKDKPLKLVLTDDEDLLNHQELFDKVINLIIDLKMQYEILKWQVNIISLKIAAKESNWTNQRRKRREKLKKNQESKTDSEKSSPEQQGSSATTNIDSSSPIQTIKRASINFDEEPTAKRLKENASNISFEDPEIILACQLVMTRNVGAFEVELQWLGGSSGRDAMHQFLQFLKNNLSAKKS